MKIFRIDKMTGEKAEVSSEEAKRILSHDYAENVCTYEEMLEMSIGGTIPCRVCILEIIE